MLEQPLRPTLHEWCQRKFAETGDDTFDLDPEDWPKRYVHGLALRDCFERYVELLRANDGVEVELHTAEVIDIVDRGEQLEVIAGDDHGQALADHVVLATGHSSNRPYRPRELALAEFAERSLATFVPSAYPLEENVVGEVAGEHGEGSRLQRHGSDGDRHRPVLDRGAGRAFRGRSDGAPYLRSLRA